MKAHIFALVLLGLAAATYSASTYWGYRNGTDVLLLVENVYRSAVKNSYISTAVDFPKSGQTNTRTITAIYVYDRFLNNSGAVATLWSGGVGYRFTSVNLKSQFNSGINSTVEIWGK